MIKRIGLISLKVLEGFIALLMYISTIQAIQLTYNGLPGDIVRPLSGTIFQSIPLLAAIYCGGAIMITLGLILRKHNIMANGFLVAIFIFTYTAIIEAYLVDYTVDTIDVTVIAGVSVILYFYEKRRYRKCLEESRLD